MILEASVHQAYNLHGGNITQIGMVTIVSKKEEQENSEFMGLTNRFKHWI